MFIYEPIHTHDGTYIKWWQKRNCIFYQLLLLYYLVLCIIYIMMWGIRMLYIDPKMIMN